jgi:hypothetical protein
MSVKTNFIIDLIAFVGFLVALEPHMTGITQHQGRVLFYLTLACVSLSLYSVNIHYSELPHE